MIERYEMYCDDDGYTWFICTGSEHNVLAMCDSSEVARLEQALRESVGRGFLRIRPGSIRPLGEKIPVRRRVRAIRLLSHWSHAARAGRLDWAIREAMGRK